MPQEEPQSTFNQITDTNLWKLVVHAPKDYNDLEKHVNQIKLKMMAGMEGLTNLKIDDQATFMQKAPQYFYSYLNQVRGMSYP